MARVDAGRLELRKETVLLGEVIDEAVSVARGAGDGFAQISEVDSGVRGLTVSADRRALKQVLITVLGNAVKFTPTGGRISVLVRRSPDGVEMAVRDTGVGIPAGRLPQLFRPFTQVEAPLNRRFHGSGLGLSIAKSLVEAHGGMIRIESGVGAGTAVTVILPASPQGCIGHGSMPHPRAGDAAKANSGSPAWW